MFGRTCEWEAAVLETIRTAREDPAVRDHVATCEACRETAEAAAWMQQFAALPADPLRLPDPGMLWWKAQLLQRWDAQRRAAAPLETGQHVQVGVGLAGCVALLAWLWPRVQNWGAEVATSSVSTWASLAPGVLMATLAIGGLLAAAMAIVAIRGIFAD